MSNVKHPGHYTQGNIECIDAIREMLGPVGFLAYCRGNALKYLWRCMYKGNTTEDLQKAQQYTEWAAETADKLDNPNKGAFARAARAASDELKDYFWKGEPNE